MKYSDLIGVTVVHENGNRYKIEKGSTSGKLTPVSEQSGEIFPNLWDETGINRWLIEGIYTVVTSIPVVNDKYSIF